MLLCLLLLPLVAIAEQEPEWTHANPPLKGKALRVHQEFMQNLKLYDDPELQDYVQYIGDLMLEQSEDAGKDYYFFIVDSPGVNAVTPGYGLVYIYRGLLTLMNSEAELAGVLAHEIGHNVGRHRTRTIGEITLGNIGAVVAGLLTNSNNVMNSVGLANQERFAENRRERELEADSYAAEFLHRAGYDPQGLLTALGSLKDYSDFQARFGNQTIAYHGTFSTHPRDDRRLKRVVEQAGELPPGEAMVGRERWREVSQGLVMGVNYSGNTEPGQQRFVSRELGITFVYPETWTVQTRGSRIVLRDPEDSVQLQITPKPLQDASGTVREEFDALFVPETTQSVELKDARDLVVGIIGADETRRLALKRYGRYDFQFVGIAKNNELSKEQDQVMVDLILDFRRLAAQDLPPENITRLAYTRLEPGETFESIAAKAATSETDQTAGAQLLRLLNGYYPRGNPEPGTFIKVPVKAPTEQQ